MNSDSSISELNPLEENYFVDEFRKTFEEMNEETESLLQGKFPLSVVDHAFFALKNTKLEKEIKSFGFSCGTISSLIDADQPMPFLTFRFAESKVEELESFFKLLLKGLEGTLSAIHFKSVFFESQIKFREEPWSYLSISLAFKGEDVLSLSSFLQRFPYRKAELARLLIHYIDGVHSKGLGFLIPLNMSSFTVTGSGKARQLKANYLLEFPTEIIRRFEEIHCRNSELGEKQSDDIFNLARIFICLWRPDIESIIFDEASVDNFFNAVPKNFECLLDAHQLEGLQSEDFQIDVLRSMLMKNDKKRPGIKTVLSELFLKKEIAKL